MIKISKVEEIRAEWNCGDFNEKEMRLRVRSSANAQDYNKTHHNPDLPDGREWLLEKTAKGFEHTKYLLAEIDRLNAVIEGQSNEELSGEAVKNLISMWSGGYPLWIETIGLHKGRTGYGLVSRDKEYVTQDFCVHTLWIAEYGKMWIARLCKPEMRE